MSLNARQVALLPTTWVGTERPAAAAPGAEGAAAGPVPGAADKTEAMDSATAPTAMAGDATVRARSGGKRVGGGGGIPSWVS